MGNGMNQEDDAVAGVAQGRERCVIREEEDESECEEEEEDEEVREHGTKTTAGLDDDVEDDEIDKATRTTRRLFEIGDLDDDGEGEGNTTTKRKKKKGKKGKKTEEPRSKRQRVGVRAGANNM